MLSVTLCACGGPLGFDFPVSERGLAAGYPTLAPLDSYESPVSPEAEADIATLKDRADALRARIETLSGPILTPTDLARLDGA